MDDVYISLLVASDKAHEKLEELLSTYLPIIVHVHLLDELCDFGLVHILSGLLSEHGGYPMDFVACDFPTAIDINLVEDFIEFCLEF